MLKALAEATSHGIPASFTAHLPKIVALLGVPLSLMFTPDAFYYGILPVIAGAYEIAGGDPLAVGRAAVLGQMTTGFPLSPLTASTFVLLGLSGVTLREHQAFMFKWAFGTTMVMALVAWTLGFI
jgi:CitMHS family citrate-Mg2+:H+ or citrate-Ca2+:H+ symporter